MTSIFQRAMGAEFGRLHPKVQERLSVSLATGTACVATGVMSRIWHGGAYTVPFLYLGASRNILFPEQAAEVPFTIENWPYLDRAGRETVSFTRTFELPHRRRRFDATMVFDPATARLVDYLGTHQHLAAELRLQASADGALLIRSAAQRFRVRRLDMPVPAVVTGQAQVREWYDDGADGFCIDVRVTNRQFGPLFGYQGTFSARYLNIEDVPVPTSVKPAREETRI
jgi:hypothetical protein